MWENESTYAKVINDFFLFNLVFLIIFLRYYFFLYIINILRFNSCYCLLLLLILFSLYYYYYRHHFVLRMIILFLFIFFLYRRSVLIYTCWKKKEKCNCERDYFTKKKIENLHPQPPKPSSKHNTEHLKTRTNTFPLLSSFVFVHRHYFDTHFLLLNVNKMITFWLWLCLLRCLPSPKKNDTEMKLFACYHHHHLVPLPPSSLPQHQDPLPTFT